MSLDDFRERAALRVAPWLAPASGKGMRLQQATEFAVRHELALREAERAGGPPGSVGGTVAVVAGWSDEERMARWRRVMELDWGRGNFS